MSLPAIPDGPRDERARNGRHEDAPGELLPYEAIWRPGGRRAPYERLLRLLFDPRGADGPDPDDLGGGES